MGIYIYYVNIYSHQNESSLLSWWFSPLFFGRDCHIYRYLYIYIYIYKNVRAWFQICSLDYRYKYKCILYINVRLQYLYIYIYILQYIMYVYMYVCVLMLFRNQYLGARHSFKPLSNEHWHGFSQKSWDRSSGIPKFMGKPWETDPIQL